MVETIDHPNIWQKMSPRVPDCGWETRELLIRPSTVSFNPFPSPDFIELSFYITTSTIPSLHIITRVPMTSITSLPIESLSQNQPPQLPSSVFNSIFRSERYTDTIGPQNGVRKRKGITRYVCLLCDDWKNIFKGNCHRHGFTFHPEQSTAELHHHSRLYRTRSHRLLTGLLELHQSRRSVSASTVSVTSRCWSALYVVVECHSLQ